MFETIKRILAEKFQVEADEIVAGAVLENLGVDSLDLVELSLVLESEFGLSISEDEITAAKTVEDIFDLVNSHIGAA
ncbi:MAG TPA: acyl carrier protein [Streptosporangiaceae bacterium]